MDSHGLLIVADEMVDENMIEHMCLTSNVYKYYESWDSIKVVK